MLRHAEIVYFIGGAGVEINDLPHLKKWFDVIKERPAVQRGLNIPEPNKFLGKEHSEEQVQVKLFSVMCSTAWFVLIGCCVCMHVCAHTRAAAAENDR